MDNLVVKLSIVGFAALVRKRLALSLQLSRLLFQWTDTSGQRKSQSRDDGGQKTGRDAAINVESRYEVLLGRVVSLSLPGMTAR